MVLKIRDNSSSAISSRGSPTNSSAPPSSSACSSASGTPRQANTTHDAELLSRLLLAAGTFNGHLPPGVDIGAMLSSLHYSDAATMNSPLPRLAEPSLSLSQPSPDTFNRILEIMPTRFQASQAIAYYFARCDILHVVFRPHFDAQALDFWQSGAIPDPHWLATFLCVTANGLLAMEDDEAERCQMPTGDGRGLLARSWLDGALQALFSGDFLKTPSLEAIRAVVLLNQFWTTWEAGKHLASATSFNTSVVACAFELNLHRDPDELAQRYSPLEAEERRRVWWALVSIDSLSRSLLGKTYAPLDPSSITTRFPSHLPDEAFSPSGDFDFSFAPHSGSNGMVTVIAIHSVSVIMHKISKAVGARHRPRHSAVRGLHDELQALEVANSHALHPTVIQSESLTDTSNRALFQALLSLAFVRLHRAALAKSPHDSPSPTADSSWHRSICLQHCNKLLNSFEGSAGTNSIAQLLISLATASAAITLAIDLLESPYENTSEETRSSLSILISVFEGPNWPSSSARVLRRAAVIVRHLSVQSEQPRPNTGNSGGAPSFSASGHDHARSVSDSPSERSYANLPHSAFLLFPPQNASQDGHYFSPNPSEQSLASFTDYYPGESYEYSSDSYAYQSAGNEQMLRLVLDAEPCQPLLKPWLHSQFGDENWGWATPAAISTPLVHSLFS
ncbi:hypothetical protein RQP46_001213 [Phenoliferia psychrophenolica]